MAYDLLLKKGKHGEIYNVCSGEGRSLNVIIDIMANILNINIHTRVSEKLVRPNDNKIIIGSNEKIKREVGWHNSIPLEKSLRDTVAYWQKGA